MENANYFLFVHSYVAAKKKKKKEEGKNGRKSNYGIKDKLIKSSIDGEIGFKFG